MPKTAMDEDDSLAAWKDKIGLSRQVLTVQSESVPKRMAELPHQKLRAGPLRPDSPHVLRSLSGCDAIHR